MLKRGAVILNNGSIGKTTITSAGWVEQEVSSSQPYFLPYGLLWWLYEPQTAKPAKFDAYSAVGYQGQYIYVSPKSGLIVVRVHDVEKTADPKRLEKIYWTGFTETVAKLVQ